MNYEISRKNKSNDESNINRTINNKFMRHCYDIPYIKSDTFEPKDTSFIVPDDDSYECCRP